MKDQALYYIIFFLVEYCAIFKTPKPSEQIEVSLTSKYMIAFVGLVILFFGISFFIGSYFRPEEGHIIIGIIGTGIGTSVLKSAYQIKRKHNNHKILHNPSSKRDI